MKCSISTVRGRIQPFPGRKTRKAKKRPARQICGGLIAIPDPTRIAIPSPPQAGETRGTPAFGASAPEIVCEAKQNLIATPPHSKILATRSKHRDLTFSNRDSNQPFPSATCPESAAADAPKGHNPARIAIPSKGSAPRGLALTLFFPSSHVTSQSTLATSLCISTRYTHPNRNRRKPLPVNNMIFSTRYKKPPPGGVATWLSRSDEDRDPACPERSRGEQVRRGGRAGGPRRGILGSRKGRLHGAKTERKRTAGPSQSPLRDDRLKVAARAKSASGARSAGESSLVPTQKIGTHKTRRYKATSSRRTPYKGNGKDEAQQQIPHTPVRDDRLTAKARQRVRSSFSILPSRRRMMRWACAAMSDSWVTRIIVLPC